MINVFISYYEQPGDLVVKTVTVKAKTLLGALEAFSKENEQEPIMARTEQYVPKA